MKTNRMTKYLACPALSMCLLSSIDAYANDLGAPNIDLSNGDFSGWTMETGYYSRNADSVCVFEWDELVTESNDRFKLINTAIAQDDPVISCDAFLENPFSDGEFSLRIGAPVYSKGAEGNGTYKATAERATYKFVVTEESKALIVNFACVVMDPLLTESNRIEDQHFEDQMPSFEMSVEFKSEDGIISVDSCSNFDSKSQKASSYMKSPTTSCPYSYDAERLKNYKYLPWTSTVYDLTDKVGYEVTITFKTHDCLRRSNSKEGGGGHEAYGYFHIETTDLKLETKYCENSDENPVIKAPKSFANYDWLVDGKNNSPAIIYTGIDSSEVQIDRDFMSANSVYTCILSGELDSCNSISLNTKLEETPAPKEEFRTPSAEFCEGAGDGAIDFTLTNGSLSDYTIHWWYGKDTATASRIRDNAPASFLEGTSASQSGTYLYQLVDKTTGCESGIKEFELTVNALPDSLKDEYIQYEENGKIEVLSTEKFKNQLPTDCTLLWYTSKDPIVEADEDGKASVMLDRTKVTENGKPYIFYIAYYNGTCYSKRTRVYVTITTATNVESVAAEESNDIVNVYTASGALVKANVKKFDALKGLANGTYVVGGEKMIKK